MSKQSSKRDVSVVFDLHRVLRKRSPRAMLFSIFAVALLLIGPLSLVIAGIGESSADDGYVGNKITITYHPGEKPTNIDGSLNGSPNGSDNYDPIQVTYYGDFASTEYNPQYWSNNIADGGSSALSKVNLEKWYPIKSYEEGKTIVFTGWEDKNNLKYYPGESTITVSGKDTSIGRSIFGSGNSCLVKGQKNVTISNVTLTSMDSIQNVYELKISDSTIHLSGRSDATTS